MPWPALLSVELHIGAACSFRDAVDGFFFWARGHCFNRLAGQRKNQSCLCFCTDAARVWVRVDERPEVPNFALIGKLPRRPLRPTCTHTENNVQDRRDDGPAQRQPLGRPAVHVGVVHVYEALKPRFHRLQLGRRQAPGAEEVAAGLAQLHEHYVVQVRNSTNQLDCRGGKQPVHPIRGLKRQKLKVDIPQRPCQYYGHSSPCRHNLPANPGYSGGRHHVVLICRSFHRHLAGKNIPEQRSNVLHEQMHDVVGSSRGSHSPHVRQAWVGQPHRVRRGKEQRMSFDSRLFRHSFLKGQGPPGRPGLFDVIRFPLEALGGPSWDRTVVDCKERIRVISGRVPWREVVVVAGCVVLRLATGSVQSRWSASPEILVGATPQSRQRKCREQCRCPQWKAPQATPWGSSGHRTSRAGLSFAARPSSYWRQYGLPSCRPSCPDPKLGRPACWWATQSRASRSSAGQASPSTCTEQFHRRRRTSSEVACVWRPRNRSNSSPPGASLHSRSPRWTFAWGTEFETSRRSSSVKADLQAQPQALS